VTKEDDERVHQTILRRAVTRLDVRINRLLRARARLETLLIEPSSTTLTKDKTDT